MSFVTRATPLGDGRPLTLDESARSVEVVASTQAPVTVFDFEEWQPVREVLLMSGCQIPESGRVPLLDCHSREHAGDIVGSFDHIRVEDGPQGPQLVGRAVFSATPDGEAPFRKVVEGHLTDVSVGYDVIAYQRIRAGEVAVIEGVTYEGPLRVTTQWRLLELSCVPIGADSFAKMRSAINNLQPARKGKKERVMSKESGQHERGKIAARLRALLGLREDPEEQPAPEEEPRQAVVTDGSGTTVEPEQLDDAELDQLVDDLGALLDEAEAEQEGREDPQQPNTPLSVSVAMSQAYIGYDLQNALREELRKRGFMRTPVVTVVTQVRVDPNDPAFENPTKPIGKFLSKEEADHMASAYGHIMKEDAGRGYRRVVASPKPVEIVEQDAINSLVDANKIVICCGGGGIPVTLNGDHLKGASAVIDKDFASCLLAKQLDADMLIILTAVEKVAINFGKEDEKWLDDLTVAEAQKYIEEGHFAAGSMLPKVQAAVDFASSGTGRTAMITLLEKAKDGIQGKTGTKIHL